MADDTRRERLLAIRKPPPPFERVVLVGKRALTPRMWRLTVEGSCVGAMSVDQPGMSLRVVVPWPGAALELPDWNGNEFLLADGSRPALRTFTPLRRDGDRLDLEIVRHAGGAISGWAESASVGDELAVSGPGAGYDVPGGASRLLVFGDETAIPAVGQLIEMAPDGVSLDVHVEVVDEAARYDLPSRAGTSVEWHVTPDDATPGRQLAATVQQLDHLDDGTFVWAAGEASAMQAIRTHLFTTLGRERSRATVRGYWKPAAD
jgi:NADPH-dependent ferric siderophore reductase